jgi:uncharacterized protein (DUF433 family)
MHPSTSPARQDTTLPWSWSTLLDWRVEGFREKCGYHSSNPMFKIQNPYRYNDRKRHHPFICAAVVQEIHPVTFTRITVDPMQMGGVPCIRGLRMPVATIIEMMADGMTPTEILGAFPDLETGDIEETLHFAADALRERQLPLAGAA